MYFTDRGIEELAERRGGETVALAWLADRLREFVDLNPEFDAVAAHLTKGRFRPGPDDLPVVSQLFEAVAVAGGRLVGIGRDTDWINESYYFYSTTASCDHDVPSMPSGWNDKLDGIDFDGTCSGVLSEHADHGGAHRFCQVDPCGTGQLGVLEDEVSSILFYDAAADSGELTNAVDLVDHLVRDVFSTGGATTMGSADDIAGALVLAVNNLVATVLGG